ncbi:hypothetical protein H0H87_000873 [Tephrocybe sp. NHM501043]|nr:hypothetical protein H0H87_000873 [Tephrocybe sp. NHM501043]
MQGRQSDPLADSFVTAQWIWTAEDNETPPTAPGEDRAFRKTYTPPPGVSATSADILITADDRFSLYVSGKLVGASPVSNNEFGWITSQRFRVSLSPGSIVFAIRGTNLNDVHTGGDSAAGLLLAIRITHSDGSIRTLASDASWRASKIIPANFEQPAVDDSGWQDPIVLGKYGMSPWFSQVKIASALPNAGGASSSTTTTLPPSAATSTSTLTISGSPLPSTSTSSLPSSTISAPESGKPNTLIQSGTAISSGTVMPSLSNDPSATTSASSDGQKGGTSSSNSSSTGPIIGGVIGGVVILALLVLIVLCRKRLFGRRPRSFDADLPHHHNETRELLVEPFTLGMPARDPFQATLEPVRKHRNLPSKSSTWTLHRCC